MAHVGTISQLQNVHARNVLAWFEGRIFFSVRYNFDALQTVYFLLRAIGQNAFQDSKNQREIYIVYENFTRII